MLLAVLQHVNQRRRWPWLAIGAFAMGCGVRVGEPIELLATSSIGTSDASVGEAGISDASVSDASNAADARVSDARVSDASNAPDASSGVLSGLVGYWKLEEKLASDPVLDSSGQGNTGTTVSGAAPSASHPPVTVVDERSRSFQGTGGGQYINLGNADVLNFAGVITLAAWVNAGLGVETNAVVLAHGYRDTPSQEVALRVGQHASADSAAVQKSTWALGTWDGVNHFAETEIDPKDFGSWVHLAGVYDGKTWHLYKNGVEIARRDSEVGALRMDAPWAIGARAPSRPANAERFFLGLIDEVRIYQRALTPSEIQELYRL